MIVEDKRDSDDTNNHTHDQTNQPAPTPANASATSTKFSFFLARYQAIQSQAANKKIKEDLIEHQWKLHQKQLRKKEMMGIAGVVDDSESDTSSNES
jgi:hypothetical protein